MSDKNWFDKSIRLWSLLLPFLLWLGLHHWGTIEPFSDNIWCSTNTTYHFRSLAHSVFPLWNPFEVWGWPDTTDNRFFGEFNPLYLIITLLITVGVSSHIAFHVFAVVLYWLGGLGFYLLVKSLWRSEFAALAAYTMFVLSFQGELLFSQISVALILFSTIWFFYFLAGFLQSRSPQEQKKYYYGFIFVLMIVVDTYLPFFFLIVLGSVIVSGFLVRPQACIEIVRKGIVFITMYPRIFMPGFMALVLACTSGVLWLLESKRGDVILLTQRNAFGAFKGVTNISLEMINNSSLMTQMSIGEIFSDLDFMSSSFSYVPIFLIILLTLGLFTRMNSLRWVIFLSAFLLLLVSLGNVTPFHTFLYHHVNFFRMFRNLYFLSPIISGFLIIIAAVQLKDFLESRPQNLQNRWGYLAYVVSVHVFWAIVLLGQEGVIGSLYATLAVSLVVFILYMLGVFDHRRPLFLMALFFVIALQPYQMISKFYEGYQSDKSSDRDTKFFEFAYMRPLRGQDPGVEKGYLESPKQARDRSGFFQKGYYGCPYSYLLYSHVPAQDLEQYVRHKFVIYDQTALMSDDQLDWPLLAASLRNLIGPAWVHDPSAVSSASFNDAVAVSEASAQLTVEDFNPNQVVLVTNFVTRKFLVFNDSYTPNWHVFVNGHKIPVYRANVAFKGIWVDPGHQRIRFQFGSPLQYAFHWGMQFLFLFFGIYVAVLFLKDKTCIGNKP